MPASCRSQRRQVPRNRSVERQAKSNVGVLGHKWETLCHSALGAGRRCRQCAAEDTSMRQLKDNLTPAKQVAQDRGGKCLATENGPRKSQVKWECSEGHGWEASFDSVVYRSTWCLKCAHVRRAAMLRADDLRAAQTIASNNGGRCFAVFDFSIKDKVPWECAVGHVWDAIFQSARAGAWCPNCLRKSETLCFEALQALFLGNSFQRNGPVERREAVLPF